MNDIQINIERRALLTFLDDLIVKGIDTAYLQIDDFLHLTAINVNPYPPEGYSYRYEYEPRDNDGEIGILGTYKQKLKIRPTSKEENK